MSFAPTVNELVHHFGSQEALASELACDPSQVRRFLRPGYGNRASKGSRATIERIARVELPFPLLMRFLRVAREELVRLKAQPGKPALRKYLIILDGFLKAHEPTDDALLMEFLYMRMMVAMSKALHQGGDPDGLDGSLAAHLAYAQECAQKGMEATDNWLRENPKDVRVAHLRAVMYVNWIQIHQEQTKAKLPTLSGRVMTTTQLDKMFRDERVLAKLVVLVRLFPYLWQALYNGLELASTLHEDRYAMWFYRGLKKCDSGFQDFDYSPGEVMPISKEIGMKYFAKKYRSTLHIPNKGVKK